MRCFGSSVWTKLGVIVAVTVGSGLCQAQAPAASLAEKLQSLASRAATAFVGQVISIERDGGTVTVSFRVDEPVLGASTQVYRLREWAGLWPSEQVRYTVGERALIFLHGANRGEFSSPVDGGEGVLPVIVRGVGVTPLLDVRRLGASILRPVGTPLPDERDGAVTLSEAVALVRAVVESSAAHLGLGLVQRPLPEQGVRFHSAPGMKPVAAGEPALVRTSMQSRESHRVAAEVPYAKR